MDPIVTLILYTLMYLAGSVGILLFVFGLSELYATHSTSHAGNCIAFGGAALAVLLLGGMIVSFVGPAWVFLPAAVFAGWQFFAPPELQMPMIIT